MAGLASPMYELHCNSGVRIDSKTHLLLTFFAVNRNGSCGSAEYVYSRRDGTKLIFTKEQFDNIIMSGVTSEDLEAIVVPMK
jgi:hypothetical protein